MFILFLMLSEVAGSTLEFVPEGCAAVVTARGAAKDPGLAWLVDSWAYTPPEVPIRRLVKVTGPDELSLAIFPSGKLLLVLGAWRREPGRGDLRALVPGAIVVRYKGVEIASGSGGQFSACSLCRGYLLVGADVGTVQEAVDAGGGRSIEDSAGYSEMMGSAHRGDLTFFADNRNLKFSGFLRDLEHRWRMSLLLSADSMEWVGAWLDVVDRGRVKGRVAFKCSDEEHIEDVRDDAEFLGETFRRKFAAEKVRYSGKVEVSGRTVVLDFEVGGLEPLWTKLLKRGVLSLIGRPRM